MSYREEAKQIIDRLPDFKMDRLLFFLRGMELDDEIEDDLYCERLYQAYVEDPDPDKFETYTLEECKKEWGMA